jgi:hypothetical protein
MSNYYDESFVSVYIMNAFEEGYRLDDGIKVNNEWIEDIYVWEALWFMIPAFKVKFTDFGMNYLNSRHIGNVVIKLGLNAKDTVTFDMANSEIKDAELSDVRRPSTVTVGLSGFGMPGLWLMGRGTKGYGVTSASYAVKAFIEGVVKSKYNKLCKYLNWNEDVDQSWDSKTYLQGGRSGLAFLAYMRDCALNKSGKQDYFTWFAPNSKQTGIAWQFNFKSLSALKNNSDLFYLEYIVNAEDWDKSWSNGGYLDNNTIPFMWYEVLSRNTAIDTAKGKFAHYFYDIGSLSVVKEVVNSTANLVGGKVKSNIVASMLNSDNTVTGMIVDGAKVSVHGTTVEKGIFEKARTLCKVNVVIPGVSAVGVGSRVRVIIPDGYSDVINALSGDWIVGGITHIWSSKGKNYFKKLTLVSDALKSEIKGV